MRLTHALLMALPLTVAPVLAQTTPQAAHRPSSRPDPYHAGLDQRINYIHQRLAITAGEQSAWDNFAQVMRDNADAVEKAFHQRSEALPTMTASQNLQNYAQIEQGRAQDVQKLSVAFDTLYTQLSDEQKKAADGVFRQYGTERAKARQQGRAAGK